MRRAPTLKEILTIGPYPGCSANDLPYVLAVIHDGPHAEGNNSQRRHISRSIRVGLGEGVDILRVGDGGFDFAP